ncbi:polysaccharide biosynthesis/export family protein [Luteolibacter yonseiensis]|uniref:Polysaccharide biosynthesis/export family protein n=2 Tax=Luteolibacter yonseiensis TaxID=1144680 RepID=A0A934VAZ7_9BACT|nr:polysaccharide biosynthesis/export family protein [Luteolibacter yonseiensis]MBK1816728.1 polysaccharide biosynthesis/export family protein [Luteolibacter yonseiensis]
MLAATSIIAFGQIEAGKSIQITISGVPDKDRATITNTYPVSESGMINMPYIGPVQAAGLRTDQLQSKLQGLYKSSGYYTNPTIQVISNAIGANVAQESVIVGGQVRRPGPVPFAKELTLWGAIQAAGGATEFGSMRRVKVIRGGNQKSYDVTKPQFMQIPLQRNDTIEVPMKTILNG